MRRVSDVTRVFDAQGFCTFHVDTIYFNRNNSLQRFGGTRKNLPFNTPLALLLATADLDLLHEILVRGGSVALLLTHWSLVAPQFRGGLSDNKAAAGQYIVTGRKRWHCCLDSLPMVLEETPDY